MKTKIGVLLLLDRMDLGGGARRIKVYCDLLDRKLYQPVVVVRAQTISRSIDAVIGSDTPRLYSQDPTEIVAFAQKQGVKVCYFWYDGRYHEDLHSLLQLTKETGIKLIGNNVFSYYDQRMDDLCDVVLFQTKFMRYKFAKAIPKHAQLSFSKYIILPNPVYDAYYKQFVLSKRERERVRRELGFTNSMMVVGRFGRNDIVKWGDVLLSTLWALRRDQRVAFLLVGVPRSRRILLEIISFFFPDLGRRVVVSSPTADDARLFALMQACDVIGHSVKIGEGCSNAINEGMYWGKPVITNPTPHCDNGQVEQVTHEVTGYVARGTKEWVEYLQILQEDVKQRKELGTAAAEFVRTHCEARDVVSELMSIIQMLLGNTRKKSTITVNRFAYERFVRRYEESDRLSGSVRPVVLLEKISDIVIRAIGYLEFRFWNG